MNAQEFVAALRIVACDKASIGLLEAICNPPGRSPDPIIIDLSKWLNSLGPEDRAKVEKLVGLATRQAVYNVLLVLDGLLAISSKGNRVDFELFVKENGRCELLNGPTGEPLTDLFNTR
jgi:hypothetical protein